jgi:hypothetical protein
MGLRLLTAENEAEVWVKTSSEAVRGLEVGLLDEHTTPSNAYSRDYSLILEPWHFLISRPHIYLRPAKAALPPLPTAAKWLEDLQLRLGSGVAEPPRLQVDEAEHWMSPGSSRRPSFGPWTDILTSTSHAFQDAPVYICCLSTHPPCDS